MSKRNKFSNSPEPENFTPEFDSNEPRKAGVIAKLITEKGFGFIADEKGTQYFFHRSGVREGWQTLAERQSVTFIVRPSPKGPRAEDVLPEYKA